MSPVSGSPQSTAPRRRVLIDTNILFSALLYPRGNESMLLLEADKGNVEALVLDYVLGEFREILTRRGIDPGLLGRFLETFHHIRILPLPELSKEILEESIREISDPKDRPIYCAARHLMESDPHLYLVTGDRVLLKASVRQRLHGRALRTGEILRIVRGEPPGT